MEEIVLNPQYSNSSSVFAEVRPIDSMRWIKQDDGSVRYLSDTRLLLNQKRLINQLGEDTYNALIQGMTPTRSSYERGQKLADSLSMSYSRTLKVDLFRVLRKFVLTCLV